MSEDAEVMEARADLFDTINNETRKPGELRRDVDAYTAAVERAVIARLAATEPLMHITSEQLNAHRALGHKSHGGPAFMCGACMVLASFDALRAKCAALSAQLEEMRREFARTEAFVTTMCGEAGAAIARAEKAEAERDAARAIIAEGASVLTLHRQVHDLAASNAKLQHELHDALTALRTERAQHERLREAAKALEAFEVNILQDAPHPGSQDWRETVREVRPLFAALRSALTAAAPAEPRKHVWASAGHPAGDDTCCSVCFADVDDDGPCPGPPVTAQHPDAVRVGEAEHDASIRGAAERVTEMVTNPPAPTKDLQRIMGKRR